MRSKPLTNLRTSRGDAGVGNDETSLPTVMQGKC